MRWQIRPMRRSIHSAPKTSCVVSRNRDRQWREPAGKARIWRKGSDVTIVGYSITVGQALEAAEKLAEEGIDAEVIDLRSIRPLDMDTILESVKKTNRCVIAHEHWPFGGPGAEIVDRVQREAFDHLDAPVLRVTGRDVPMPYALNLEERVLVRAEDIVTAAKRVLYRA